MKKGILTLKSLCLTALIIAVAQISVAQIVAWQFTLPEPSTGKEITANATTNDANLEQSVLTRGKNAVPGEGSMRGFNGSFPVEDTKEKAVASGSYYQFNVKAKKGYKVSLTSLESVVRRQAESAHIYRWAYSLDGKTFKDAGEEDIVVTDLNGWGVAQPAIALSKYKDLQNVPSSVNILFRIYVWGGTAAKGHERSFGFGKSKANGSNVLSVYGTVTKE